MSGKPKVYQGVRVKITVKELLQQRRARQAAASTMVSLGSSSIQFSESVSPPHPAPFDAESISSAPSSCPSWQFSDCLSCEESRSYLEELVDSCLQTEAPLDPALSALQTPSHYISDSFQPVPHCLNQSLEQETKKPRPGERLQNTGHPSSRSWTFPTRNTPAPGSPSSTDPSSPLNYSCSPPQLPPFNPLPHSPPSALDTKTLGYPAEGWSCHGPSLYSASACCCASCGPEHGDTRLPEYLPCPGTDCMDYLPPVAVADDFFRRAGNWDICYS